MARLHNNNYKNKSAAAPSKSAAVGAGKKKAENEKMSKAQRSAYFARREAAKVLRAVLDGDARRRAVGSIKSLVYSPSVRNKRGTFALVCQTLKYLQIIKDVLEASGVVSSKWKKQVTLMYLITYDILFGQADSLVGDAEKFILNRKDAIQSALSRLMVTKKVKRVEDLVALYKVPDVSKPRYVRVNTLKLDLESATKKLGKQYKVHKDDLVPNLLILPPGTDLHNHPLVTNGSVFMQGKASSMVAVALDPQPGWEVLDACSAPGNKTVHLAALMGGKGKIIACEVNKERVKRLEDTVKLAGATNVKVLNEDFLNIDPKDPAYSKLRAILLDPSCSGSGTAIDRLDHLLPSYNSGNADLKDTDRLTKLAAFQKRALEHAFSFPTVERVVYSTCSIHQIENEDVIKSVLHLADSYGFHLGTPLPQWPRRGLPVIEGSECLLRTDPDKDKEGFFIALFARNIDRSKAPTSNLNSNSAAEGKRECLSKRKKNKNKFVSPYPYPRMSRLLHHHFNMRKLNKT